MKLGTNDIGSVYLGTNAVQKVYLGTNLVWSASSLLLDTYTGAAAAYSLRKLRSGYSGNAIKVRRSVGSPAETDIGFVDNELDIATLESFCSGTDGFVTTWYDQSGNGYDATQTTASNQPKIVSSGSVLTDSSGNPIIKYGSSPSVSYLVTSTITMGNDELTIFVYRNVQDSIQMVAELSTSTSTNTGSFYVSTYNGGYESPLSRGSATVSATQKALFTTPTLGTRIVETDYHKISTDLTQIYVNGTQGTDGTGDKGSGTFNDYPLYFGARAGSVIPFTGFLSEFIMYKQNELSNRTGIETNINDFYSIY